MTVCQFHGDRGGTARVERIARRKLQQIHTAGDLMTMPREVPLSTPGEILLEEWLTPMGLTQYELAKAIGVPPRRIHEIVKGQRAITADTAVRLAAYFGTDAQSWMNLQAHQDTELAKERIGPQFLAAIRQHATSV